MIGIALKLLARYWVHLLVIVSIAAVINLIYKAGAANERERWEKKAYQATIASQEAASKFTAGVLTSHREITNDAQVKIDSHDIDTGNADSLRDQLAAAIKRSADNSARLAHDRKAAEARYRMLSELHKESDRLAGIYAAQADRNRIAGEACEHSYNELQRWIIETYGSR